MVTSASTANRLRIGLTKRCDWRSSRAFFACAAAFAALGTGPGTVLGQIAAKVEVSVEIAYVRAGPGVSYSVLVALPRGTKLAVVTRRSPWWQVIIDGRDVEHQRVGFLHESVVRLVTEQAQRPMVPVESVQATPVAPKPEARSGDPRFLVARVLAGC